MVRYFFIIHFALFAFAAAASDSILKVDAPKPSSEKYQQLFTARFLKWYSVAFKFDSNLSQKQQQTLKRILAEQNDFSVRVGNAWLNTFSVGYVECASYHGQIVRVLRGDMIFDKSIEELTGHKPPMTDKPLYRGFEILGAGIRYVVVTATEIKTYDFAGKGWVLGETILLNQPAEVTTPVLKEYYQTDTVKDAKEIWLHSSGFINEKYMSMPAQEIMTAVRARFNLDPSLVQFTDSKNFKFYYP